MDKKLILWWRTRTQRERLILLVWGSVMLLLFLWLAVLSPLNQRVQQLEKRIPQLESKFNELRYRSAERAATRPKAGKASQDLRSDLFRLLADKKISAELRAISNTRVEIRLPELSLAEAIDVLQMLRQESGARISVFNLRNEKTGSAVNIIAEFESRQ